MDYKDIIKQMIADGIISQEVAEKYIHELKESENERIRKAITEFFKNFSKNGTWKAIPDVTKWIAWLEKQGKNNMGISEATKQVLEDNLNKALEKETPESCNEFLEKQGEQKTADKVEPKFHEGEWVTDGTSVFQIVKIESEWYIADDGERVCFDVVHQYYHLWTIQDAKVGDILFQDLMDGMTFIFDGVNPEMAILYSFIINNDGEDVLPYDIGKPNTGIGDIEENKNIIHPATKEQRDLLFQKMYDAGYEWDAEKKELKNIEYEIEIPFGAKDSELQEVTYYIPKGFHAEIDDNEVVIKKGEKPTKWSKEDEQYLLVCKNALAKYQTTDKWDACIISQWLDNHLRPQNTWKPSDEQINALEYYIYSTSPTATITKGTIYGNLMVELLEQLKKLKKLS